MTTGYTGFIIDEEWTTPPCILTTEQINEITKHRTLDGKPVEDYDTYTFIRDDGHWWSDKGGWVKMNTKTQEDAAREQRISRIFGET